ncbi:hypothetical protein ECPA39_4059, partial [Escherichia coli PA39]
MGLRSIYFVSIAVFFFTIFIITVFLICDVFCMDTIMDFFLKLYRSI